jgi:hypothetical protein
VEHHPRKKIILGSLDQISAFDLKVQARGQEINSLLCRHRKAQALRASRRSPSSRPPAVSACPPRRTRRTPSGTGSSPAASPPTRSPPPRRHGTRGSAARGRRSPAGRAGAGPQRRRAPAGRPGLQQHARPPPRRRRPPQAKPRPRPPCPRFTSSRNDLPPPPTFLCR